MNTQRFKRMQELFEAALETPEGKRDSFLRDACADDEELYREVSALLKHDAKDQPALDGDPAERLAASAARTGHRIGAYEVGPVVGEGGMGTVYVAERADGEYDKRVAIKVMREGLVGQDGLRRFDIEKQILATLDHPNIARLLDSGVTDDGRPYVVMDYVGGVPITEYCRDRAVSLDDTLRLFIEVCAAVHHAHQNLVIHRDLKPDNILVTADGQVRLLDFGIAKLVQPDGGETESAKTATRLLTPKYAAPEQLLGQPPTTTTDVYALGVLLYELVTGQPPYRLDGDSPVTWQEVICEHAPTHPRRVDKRVPDDIGTICLFALRKEPSRRYGAASDLAADIERYMRDEPIRARPDTIRYKARKFVARHRIAVASLAVLAIAVSAVTAVYTTRLARARDRAETQARKADRLADFMVSLYTNADPAARGGKEFDVKALLDSGLARLDTELADQPEARAKLLSALGATYANISEYDAAKRALARALTLRRAHPPGDSEHTADVLARLAYVHRELGDYDAADGAAREALAMRQRLFGERDRRVAELHVTMGEILYDRGKGDKAAPLFQKALDIFTELAPGSTAVADARVSLSLAARAAGRYSDSETQLRQARAIYLKHYGLNHPHTAASINDLADAIRKQGRLDEAEPLYRQALALRRKLFGDHHADVAHSLNHLGRLLSMRGKPVDAEGFLRRALAIRASMYGEDHPAVAASRSALAGVLLAQGRAKEAKLLYERSYVLLRKKFGAKHRYVAAATSSLAAAHAALGERQRAVALFRQSLALHRELMGPEHVLVAAPLTGLGAVLCHTAPAEAEPLLRRAHTMRERAYAPTHPRLAQTKAAWGKCLVALKRYQRAEPLLLAAHRTARARLRVAVAKDLVALYRAWGKPDKARAFR